MRVAALAWSPSARLLRAATFARRADSPQRQPSPVIGLLLRFRYLTAALTTALLIVLVFFGKKVSYEQSIGSFFADDDPYMAVYQKAASSFGDDNFVFLAYDDPDLVTPRGLDRVAELAAAVGPDRIAGVMRVESLDAMPLVWSLDDILIALDRLPALARNMALNAARRTIKNVDLQDQCADGRRGGTGRRSARAGGAQGPLEPSSPVPGHVDRRDGHDHGRRGAAAQDARAQCDRDDQGVARRGRSVCGKHGLGRPAVVGPPVLLADGFAAIEVDGRRLAVVGMFLIALVTLSAVHSVWWAIVPMIAGWTIWLATETLLHVFHIKLSLSGGPLVAQIIVLTMPAASHLAIHFRDDRRREADPSIAGRLTLRGVAAPILWTAITGAIGYGALVTSNLVPVQQFGAILGICTLCSAILVMVISPIAMMPPFPLEIPVREGSRSRVGAAMNRLTFWVFRHPGAILIVVTLVVVPLSLGILGLRYETNYINLFRRETRVVRDYGSWSRSWEGSAWSSWWFPSAIRSRPGRWPNLPVSGNGCRRSP